MFAVHVWLLEVVEHIGQVIRMRPILRLHVALAHYTIEQKAPMSQSSTSQVVP